MDLINTLKYGLTGRKSGSIPEPIRTVNSYVHDAGGYQYMHKSCIGRREDVTFDMTRDEEKARALMLCTPFFMVCDKLGSMASRGVPYVMDDDGNERDAYDDVRALLAQPNPLQTWTSFVKQVELSLSAFGYAPISFVRATPVSLPKAMWVLPAERFHLYGTGRWIRQTETGEVIARAFVKGEDGLQDIELQTGDYAVIYNSMPIMRGGTQHEIDFVAPCDALSAPVSNWTAAMAATHTLLVHGGPKGILYSDYADDMGNTQLTRDEEMAVMDRFKQQYGLVGQDYPILVTRYRLGWLPLDFNADQLKLQETDDRATRAIATALGVNVSLFTESKYDNQESAKKGAYQDVVIPDSKKIAETLTRMLCTRGEHIEIDFSDVECLQKDKRAEADTLRTAGEALRTLVTDNIITITEARERLADYIDIDPSAAVPQINDNSNE